MRIFILQARFLASLAKTKAYFFPKDQHLRKKNRLSDEHNSLDENRGSTKPEEVKLSFPVNQQWSRTGTNEVCQRPCVTGGDTELGTPSPETHHEVTASTGGVTQ